MTDGNKDLCCSICKNNLNNKVHKIKEMMFAVGHAFDYLECGQCGCIQIIDIPDGMEQYYPANYYSYAGKGESYILKNNVADRVKKYLKKSLTSHYKFKSNLPGKLMSPFVKDGFSWLKEGIVNFDSRIIDIGCGSGELLLNMKYNGFKHLEGADPYIAGAIHYQCGVSIEKKSIYELDGGYDLIMMHHSFEHMSDPAEVCKKAHELLNDGGYLLINIPVADCYAWRKYGVNWVQLDAPRHFFIHTTQSMSLLAKENGFALEDVLYNSTEFQFTGSELYLRGGNFFSNNFHFTKEQTRLFKKQAGLLNEKMDGDSAVFYFKKETSAAPKA